MALDEAIWMCWPAAVDRGLAPALGCDGGMVLLVYSPSRQLVAKGFVTVSSRDYKTLYRQSQLANAGAVEEGRQSNGVQE